MIKKRHRPRADSNHKPLIHKPDVLSTQPRSLTQNNMNFLNTINIVSQLLGLKNQTKTDGLVSQKSDFLKHLRKPRKTAHFLRCLHPYKTFLFNDLGRTMPCYVLFLSLKNGYLHSKIEPFLKYYQKIPTLMSII